MTEVEAFLAQAQVIPGCRWTAKRKLAILTAMERWPTESAEIMRQHGISADEVIGWRKGLSREGFKGLAAKNIRPPSERLDAPPPPPHRQRATKPPASPANPWRDT